MANNFFRFKQFTIYQDKCAMKVCTDACLFGAWVVEKVKSQKSKPKNVLDIGAGTGLLSLMVVQQLKCDTDAIEIEKQDFQQCSRNFEQSAWNDLLHPVLSDIKKFQTGKQYDLIISNPPFFENDLKPAQQHKHRAKHDLTLNLEELFRETERLLAANGHAAFLLPYHRKEEGIETAAEYGLFPLSVCGVRQTEKHEPFRVMILFGKGKPVVEEKEIAIQYKGQYSGTFIELLKDYYLYL